MVNKEIIENGFLKYKKKLNEEFIGQKKLSIRSYVITLKKK